MKFFLEVKVYVVKIFEICVNLWFGERAAHEKNVNEAWNALDVFYITIRHIWTEQKPNQKNLDHVSIKILFSF